ncbi:unnamed protein product, partial [Rotaria magnacalcarata]
MNQSNVHLLNLPNEILLIILKKLNSIDVLYSLLGINSDRLNILAQEKVFTNTLNFVSALIDDNRAANWPQKLGHLSIIGSSMSHYPALALHDVPTTTLSSSILTKLCITTNGFDDCLCLLEGRLKPLATLVVITYGIDADSTIVQNMNDLPNLKCFSLTCDFIDAYDAQIVPLLRHMSYLEELTLYLCIENRDTFVDGTHVHNEILSHMPQLHSFVFYIRTDNDTIDSMRKLSNDDILQAFKNFKNQKMVCMTYYPAFIDHHCDGAKLEFDDNQSDTIIDFPHLISLTTYLPCLTKLIACDDQLVTVTESFTADATRLNYAE